MAMFAVACMIVGAAGQVHAAAGTAGPPAYTAYADYARWMVANLTWGVITTTVREHAPARKALRLPADLG